MMNMMEISIYSFCLHALAVLVLRIFTLSSRHEIGSNIETISELKRPNFNPANGGCRS